ncbi:MAG: hypothetical protein N2205_00235 [Candidatus Caldatribacterium sp.]|uniref:hypothetical protein n=1 Tax=Candidatus Caldatribacterium sp. TaxID=2282143 RepID=UPI002997F9AB|nr:hypothetical protein [Candidatus Caldatribacterium sp.]MCX7729630.1 hypothetical protein [Candidatus Caldatribacterium sp.]MDW8080950.1 hypothetical protein [Candidatus Calescibacterium sp.]
MLIRVWAFLLCFFLLFGVSGHAAEEVSVKVAQILGNPSHYLMKEVVLQGKVIQIVHKEIINGKTLWEALLSDGSTLGVAYVMGIVEAGRVPVEGDRLRLRCIVFGVTTYETVVGSTNEAVLCVHGEELGDITFIE